MSDWIDTHCHIDAPEFDADQAGVRARAAGRGVAHCVYPAVEVANFEAVRQAAHAYGDSYALGIHPLYVGRAADGDLAGAGCTAARQPRRPAAGGCGRDRAGLFSCRPVCEPAARAQEHFYREQLRLARRSWLAGDPACAPLGRPPAGKHLRALGQAGPPWSGLAHAFAGSARRPTGICRARFQAGIRRCGHLRARAAAAPSGLARCRWTPWCWRPMRRTSRRTGCTARRSRRAGYRRGATSRASCPKLVRQWLQLRACGPGGTGPPRHANACARAAEAGTACWYNAPWP
jgi:Tat protein secretion system quality control protein TatD with DNase activity